ncbi:MAG: bifunctional folylpolyglutamate synthase/dihydrofolate synthase [Bacteroidales bacterium]|nr:bifunctional folylpolyglutamate synthase/dihydrofolate synthase [Bacteroidales bacterium]
MPNDIEYNKMIEALFAAHPSVQNSGFNKQSYKPGLQQMESFSSRLGDPHKKLRCIHIAGTNGKGSVSSMLSAALASLGYRVGLFTSPHLVDFRERIKLVTAEGFDLISKQEVWDFVQNNNLEGLSFFEITTGMAFSWFATQNLDYAVIETGLGGRLDSTNIITPELSIITSIGIDHANLLGGTLEQIASEKAGIIKPGVPVVIGSHNPLTDSVFEAHAQETGSPLSYADAVAGELPECDLTGEYQAANIRTTVQALNVLGLELKAGALAHTASLTGLRGRWETLQSEPQLICDIGHNEPALRINFATLKSLNRPLYIVFGMMADKDVSAVRALMPQKAKYFLVQPQGQRAMKLDDLAQIMDGLDFVKCGSVEDGVAAAIEAARTVDNALVYVGGSNFVVSECILSIER